MCVFHICAAHSHSITDLYYVPSGSLKDILKRDVESRKKDLEIVKNEMKSEGDSKDKKGQHDALRSY